jgi:hypothetical protein
LLFSSFRHNHIKVSSFKSLRMIYLQTNVRRRRKLLRVLGYFNGFV